jgi:adenylate cyclase
LILENNVEEVRSVMCTPLILAERVIGTFGVMKPKTKKHFDIDDVNLLTAVASQADTAIFEDISIQKIKRIFKRYVSEKVFEKMLAMKDKYFLTGQKLDMSVSFADIRGFTSMAERLDNPDRLVQIINEFLSAMTDVILAHDGTVDKFVGDEIMALFGAPVHFPEHAKVAVETAIAMQKKMGELQEMWKQRGDEPCEIGIGINTGEMVAGNIGSDKMSDYTVLGDNVNLGARLCSAAEANQILVSHKTYEQTKDFFQFRELPHLKVKGKEKPLPVYEVVYE